MANFTVMAITNSTQAYPHLLLITNFGFWLENQSRIEAWCETYTPQYQHTGMLMSFLNEKDRTLFMLRWG